MPRIDDSELDDETLLWRRVLPNWLTTDENGEYRPQSLAFIDRLTNEVSVFVGSLTEIGKVLKDHPGDSLVAIKAGVPRGVGGIVAKTPENPDLSHRVLCYSSNSQMRRAAKLLTDNNNYSWIVLNTPSRPA